MFNKKPNNFRMRVFNKFFGWFLVISFFIVFFAIRGSSDEVENIMKLYGTTNTSIVSQKYIAAVEITSDTLDFNYDDNYDEMYFDGSIDTEASSYIEVPVGEFALSEETKDLTKTIVAGETFSVNNKAYPVTYKISFDGKIINAINFFSYDSSSNSIVTNTDKANINTMLRQVTIEIYTPAGNTKKKTLTVHKDVADSVVSIFREIYALKFPIEEVGAQDWREGRYRYKYVSHPNGLAIDINWSKNPYYTDAEGVHAGNVAKWEKAQTNRNPGIITPEVVAIFKKYGWFWGGDWKSMKDYMHFSVTGH